jgi:predicted NUDIX family NTP pyrophosphohydrolase
MKQSAEILLYKTEKDQLKILLAKPGGPLWKNRDTGVWRIPKGELDEGEAPCPLPNASSWKKQALPSPATACP